VADLDDPGWCPVCEGEQPVAIGQPPERGDTRHSRGCPVRGPGWHTPPRHARPPWRDPAETAAALAPPNWTEADRKQVQDLRAAGASYSDAGAAVGVGKGQAWKWCHGQ
jgi:hypothetical protein